LLGAGRQGRIDENRRNEEEEASAHQNHLTDAWTLQRRNGYSVPGCQGCQGASVPGCSSATVRQCYGTMARSTMARSTMAPEHSGTMAPLGTLAPLSSIA
jgi:hypothetical protein